MFYHKICIYLFIFKDVSLEKNTSQLLKKKGSILVLKLTYIYTYVQI